MRRLYESLLDDEEDWVNDETIIVDSQLDMINADVKYWETYFGVHKGIHRLLNPKEHTLLDYDKKRGNIIINNAKLHCFHFERSINNLHDIIPFDYKDLIITGSNSISINSTKISPKTYSENIYAYCHNMYFDVLEEIKDVKIAVTSTGGVSFNMGFITANPVIKNVYVALNLKNGLGASKSYLSNSNFRISQAGIVNLSEITCNAEAITYYDCSMFDDKDNCSVLEQIIDINQPVTIYDKLKKTTEGKKLKIPKLVAAVNNAKRYRFDQVQCHLKPNVKLTDVLGLKNFPNVDIIRIGNNNVEFNFTKSKSRMKEILPFTFGNFNDSYVSDENVPVTADGWYLIIRKV